MLRSIFKIIILVILIVAGYIGYAYYNYQKGGYRDLEVKYGIDDYNKTVLNKLKIDIKDKDKLFYGAKIKGSGEQKMEKSFSSAEVSALINYTNELKGRIKNFQLRFIGNNEFEASFYYSDLKYQLFLPVNIKGALSYVGSNTVTFRFNEIYLGDYTLPKFLRERAANDFNIYVNNSLGGLDVFEIDKLEINKDLVSFKGLLPTKIEGHE